MRILLAMYFCVLATGSGAQDTVTYYRLKDKNEPTKGYLLAPSQGAQSLVFQPCEGKAFEVTDDQIEQTSDTCGGPPGTLYTFEPKALIGAPVYTWNKEIVGNVAGVDKADGKINFITIDSKGAQSSIKYKIPVENFDVKKTGGNNYEVMYLKGTDALMQESPK
jgi:hypothetical protein